MINNIIINDIFYIISRNNIKINLFIFVVTRILLNIITLLQKKKETFILNFVQKLELVYNELYKEKLQNDIYDQCRLKYIIYNA